MEAPDGAALYLTPMKGARGACGADIYEQKKAQFGLTIGAGPALNGFDNC